MKTKVIFAGTSWEVLVEIENLNSGDFQFYTDRLGKTYIGVHTKDWVPDKTKCSPRYKKYYGKYLQNDISRMCFEDQKELVDRLIRLGYCPKSEKRVE